MTAADALRTAIPQLDAAGIVGPARDARLLLAHAMGRTPDRLTLHLAEVLSPEALARFQQAVAARGDRQPVSQITGQRLFWGRSFHVTRDVLDPRPETETLVAAALGVPFSRCLDLGTGSGAILVTLLAERQGATGIGTDLSPPALQVARRNAIAQDIGRRAEFQLSDWFGAVQGRYDLIVSNPPYIAEAEMSDLAPEVRDWEPRIALTPGGDGLDVYRKIAADVGRFLVPGGHLIVEIGPTQTASVTALFAAAGLIDTVVRCDMDGRDRVVLARHPPT